MAESGSDSSTGRSALPADRRLDSWKEIASYLNRDVTTVRRWEKREGLPVHRHRHAALGSVYAFTNEIDHWQSGRERPVDREQPLPLPPSDPRARLVGRETELRRLHDHFVRALAGQRATVFIAGELGIGKTALTRTFLDEVRSEVWVAEGQCVEQYGKSDPYLPILEALARMIRDVRYPDAIRVVNESHTRFRRRRQRGEEPNTEQIAGELIDTLEALSAVKPLVLVLEDLHWSDRATVELLARLARRPDRGRLLIIGTYRPAELFESGSPLLRVGRELRAHFQADEIELSLLTREAVGELITRNRKWKDLHSAAAALRQWSGNPLFLVHVLEHLERCGRMRERDGEWYLNLDRQEDILPNSLRMLVEEQFDRLDPENRRLLEAASVVGGVFPAAIVARAAPVDVTLVERSFEDLCKRSHLVARREAAEFPDGTASATYAFVHEFYRQVVYERLPRATSIDLHRKIGAQLEAAYGPRTLEISPELAMHFDRGQDFSRAIRHYRIAAQNAVARNADREAHIALCTAAELTDRLSQEDERERTERDLRAQLASVAERFARQIQWTGAGLDEEVVEIRRVADDNDLIDTMVRLSGLHGVAGDLAAAREISDRAAAIQHASEGARLEAIAQQAHLRLLVGEFSGSRSLAIQGLGLADRGGVDSSNRDRIRCLIVLACTTWYLGRYDELRDTIESLLSNDETQGSAGVASSVAPLLEWLGETDRSLTVLRPRRVRERRSSLGGAPWPAEAVHGWLLVRRRRAAQGLGILREQARLLRTNGMHAWLPYTLVWLSEALSNLYVDEALAATEEGIRLVRHTGLRCCDAELYRARGEAMNAKRRSSTTAGLVDRNRDDAESSYWAGITVARQQDARTLELRATVGLCRLLIDAGRRDEGIRTLARVCDAFSRSDDTPDLREARKLVSG
jgi:hypothetical protein